MSFILLKPNFQCVLCADTAASRTSAALVLAGSCILLRLLLWTRAPADGEHICSCWAAYGSMSLTQRCVQRIEFEWEPFVLIACGKDDVE